MLAVSELLSRTIEGYEIEALLYENGITAIFVAHRGLDTVVLKVGIAKEAQSLMEREHRVLSTLQHPGIISMLGSFTLNGMPALVLERHARGNFLSYMKEFSAEEIEDFFLLLCDALSYLWKKGITHRDIKPENILLSSARRPILIDFGLAYIKGDAYSSFLGTHGYAAPELVDRSAPPQLWSDGYALALVMHQLLHGCLPAFIEDEQRCADIVKQGVRVAVPIPAGFSPKSGALWQRYLQPVLHHRKEHIVAESTIAPKPKTSGALYRFVLLVLIGLLFLVIYIFFD